MKSEVHRAIIFSVPAMGEAMGEARKMNERVHMQLMQLTCP